MFWKLSPAVLLIASRSLYLYTNISWGRLYISTKENHENTKSSTSSEILKFLAKLYKYDWSGFSFDQLVDKLYSLDNNFIFGQPQRLNILLSLFVFSLFNKNTWLVHMNKVILFFSTDWSSYECTPIFNWYYREVSEWSWSVWKLPKGINCTLHWSCR